MEMNYLDVLKRCELFRNVIESDIRLIIKTVDPKLKSFDAGSVVLKADSQTKDFCIVIKGCLNEDNYKYYKPGDVFGLKLAATGSINRCCIWADEDTQVLYINYKKLMKCSGLDMPFFYRITENITANLSTENLYLRDRLRILSKTTLKLKLMEFFRFQSILHGDNILSLSMSRLEIANYLCVDRCSLSRELTKLKKEGYIDIERQRIIIKPALLQKK